MGANVFPTGVTKYDPERAWNGYTLMPVNGIGAVLIDMNGNVVRTGRISRVSPTSCCPAAE